MKFKRFSNQIYSCFKVEKTLRGNVFKEPYKSNDKWYMSIYLDEISSSLIKNYELSFEIEEKVKIQQSIKDRIIIVKLPYRYNRFECRAFDHEDDPLTMYDIKKGNRIKANVEHACFSYQNENILSTWKLKSVIIDEDSGSVTGKN